jgi:pilus assembly protein Flp/PilA
MIKRTAIEMRRLWQDESGAAALEYGLIVAGIALAIIISTQSVGTGLAGMFGRIATAVGNIAPTGT